MAVNSGSHQTSPAPNCQTAAAAATASAATAGAAGSAIPQAAAQKSGSVSSRVEPVPDGSVVALSYQEVIRAIQRSGYATDCQALIPGLNPESGDADAAEKDRLWYFRVWHYSSYLNELYVTVLPPPELVAAVLTNDNVLCSDREGTAQMSSTQIPTALRRAWAFAELGAVISLRLKTYPELRQALTVVNEPYGDYLREPGNTSEERRCRVFYRMTRNIDWAGVGSTVLTPETARMRLLSLALLLKVPVLTVLEIMHLVTILGYHRNIFCYLTGRLCLETEPGALQIQDFQLQLLLSSPQTVWYEHLITNALAYYQGLRPAQGMSAAIDTVDACRADAAASAVVATDYSAVATEKISQDHTPVSMTEGIEPSSQKTSSYSYCQQETLSLSSQHGESKLVPDWMLAAWQQAVPLRDSWFSPELITAFGGERSAPIIKWFRQNPVPQLDEFSRYWCQVSHWRSWQRITSSALVAARLLPGGIPPVPRLDCKLTVQDSPLQFYQSPQRVVPMESGSPAVSAVLVSSSAKTALEVPAAASAASSAVPVAPAAGDESQATGGKKVTNTQVRITGDKRQSQKKAQDKKQVRIIVPEYPEYAQSSQEAWDEFLLGRLLAAAAIAAQAAIDVQADVGTQNMGDIKTHVTDTGNDRADVVGAAVDLGTSTGSTRCPGIAPELRFGLDMRAGADAGVGSGAVADTVFNQVDAAALVDEHGQVLTVMVNAAGQGWDEIAAELLHSSDWAGWSYQSDKLQTSTIAAVYDADTTAAATVASLNANFAQFGDKNQEQLATTDTDAAVRRWQQLLAGRQNSARWYEVIDVSMARLLRKGGSLTGNYRLVGTTMYLTREPNDLELSCALNARVSRVVYSRPDPEHGGCINRRIMLNDHRLNHQLKITGGVYAAALPGTSIMPD